MQDIKTRTGNNYLQRFLLALLAIAALALTFLFFSPVEIVMLNATSFWFSGLGVVVPVMGIFSAAVIVVGAAALGLFRGKLFDALLAICLALALCLYVQGTFMAASAPPLSGDEVDWTNMKTEMLVNTAIWIVLFCIPLILLRFRQVWVYARILIPTLIIVMQLTGFVSLLARPDANGTEAGYLTYDGFCDFSNEGNTLVFMLDRLDHEYIDAVLADDPDFFDRLDGFTCYDNAISQFAHTRPAMNFMLTNYDATMFTEPADDFYVHSWDDGERHILKDLTDAGYTVDLYGIIRSLMGKNYASFTPFVSNIKMGTDNINPRRFVLRMATLSAYRDFPLAMKPFFRYSMSEYVHVYRKNTNCDTDPTAFDRRLPDMTVSEEGGKRFKFYEFSGSHAPYTLNADGTKSDAPTDVVTQTKGSFEILLRAFDRMKAAGIYKDTAIIILGDHGYMDDNYAPLKAPVRIGLFYKPAGVEGTPLQNTYAPVSHRNIPATILKSAGLDYSAYGVPLDEVPDDKTIVRDHVRTIADRDIGWKDCWALHYDVAYDASKFESWTLKSKDRIQYSLCF